MKRRVILVCTLVILAFVALVAYRVHSQRSAFADAPAPPSQAVSVETARVGNLEETLDLTGTVIFPSAVWISPKVVGTVRSLYIDEGQGVSRGQLLAVIDHGELYAQLAQARASLAVARANLDLAMRGAQKEQIIQALAVLKGAEANLTWADNDYRRFKELFDMQAITRQQLEMAANKLQVAREQVAGSRAALQQLQAGTRPEQIAAARGQLQGAQASILLIETQIADHNVRAPVAGRITQKFVEVGSLVSPTAPLLSLAQTVRPQVEVAVPETELGQLRPGLPVKVTAPSLESVTLAGRLAIISPIVDPQARLIKAKITLQPVPALSRLRGGMMVDTKIAVSSHTRSILVPSSALNLDASGKASVFVVEPDNRARARIVTVLMRQPLQAAVRGLQAGEQVIVTGNAFVRDGDLVSVQPPLRQ